MRSRTWIAIGIGFGLALALSNCGRAATGAAQSAQANASNQKNASNSDCATFLALSAQEQGSWAAELIPLGDEPQLHTGAEIH